MEFDFYENLSFVYCFIVLIKYVQGHIFKFCLGHYKILDRQCTKPCNVKLFHIVEQLCILICMSRNYFIYLVCLKEIQ